MNAKLAPADATIDAIFIELQPHLSSAAQVQQARTFVHQFFSRVAEDDVAVRDAKTWAALLRGLMDFIRVRGANAPSVRVFNPSLENDGWESNYTVVEIATNDMPFLVDSIGIAAHEQGLSLHGLIHPVYFIARDPGGNLLSLATDDSNKGKPESVMYLEVDRLSELAEMERLQKAMVLALHDVAAAVADWPAMKAKMLEMADNVGKWKLPLDATGVADAQEFLRWAATDHFTFLGYREYQVVKKGDDEVLEASPKTGLGILRGGEKQVAPRSLKTLVSHELRKSGTATR